MPLNARRCLIIPDVHQDIAWVERILMREDAGDVSPDLIVFLGDYFDSRRPVTQRAGTAETCVYLDALRVRLGERAIFLLGNHDVQYLEARAACLARRTPRHLRYKCGAAFSHSAAKRIAKDLSPEFWSAARLFVSVNGWLLSHAGVAAEHWPLRAIPVDSLRAFDEACVAALETITAPLASHPLLEAGRVRGGDAEVGGITWLDWDDEFADELPFPQVVGHTSDESGARQRGCSWCLDGGQTCYGVLGPAGLSVRSV
jgi:3',5'-cyclic AMP phosphodiesterase CpdA